MIYKNEMQMILPKMKLFHGLTNDELEIVASHGKRLSVSPSKTILHEGDTSPGLHLLITGVLEVFLPEKSDDNNRRTRIHLCNRERGDFVGEYSLIDNKPASASVITKEECLIFYISTVNFKKIIDTNDLIAKKIYKNMLELLVGTAREYNSELDVIF